MLINTIKDKGLNAFNIKIFFITTFAILFTFPLVELNFGAGIDYPLLWVYNYLFHGHIQLGKDIIFPHGPLAFLMYPLKENYFIYLLVTVILQYILSFQLFYLAVYKNEKHENWLFTLFITILLFKICGNNLLIIVTIASLFLNAYLNEKKYNKYLAYIITALAFYIKSYVAIISGVIIFCFLCYELFKKKNYLEFIKDALFIWGLIILFWLILYHSFSGFFRYCYGVINLAQDNSSAAAYYPDNNWLLLTFFIIPLFIIPFVNKSNKLKFFISLLALSIFAAWKHGMAREDSAHARGFFFLLFCFVLLFFLFIKKNTLRNFALISVSLVCFYINLTHVYSYSSVSLEFSGINNFVDLLTNYSDIKYKAAELTKKNLKENILSDSVVNIIGKQKVDVYPWDYSIIPANNLEWQPRVVIHSYAAYTSWLDKEDAKHIESNKAATFLIWQLNKVSKNILTGCFESIDGRYLLNDEPAMMISLLQNYMPVYKDDKIILYKRRAEAITVTSKTINKTTTTWNKWINTPDNIEDLTRVKLNITGNILQKLKSFFYKDEFFYIYCKMEDSTITKWRIVPKNAKDGLWINPMIIDPSKKLLKVVSVLFKNSNPRLFKEHIDLEWISYKFNSDSKLNYPISFFNNDSFTQENIIFKSCNSFEIPLPNWSADTANVVKTTAFQGDKSFLLKSKAFSPSITIDLDSLPTSTLYINTNCWIKKLTRNNPLLKLIISIDSKNENVLWESVNSADQMIDNNWNYVSHAIVYNNNTKGRKLMVYLMNTSTMQACIDNFDVIIKERAK